MKIERYKHSSEVSYTLGATLTYELLKRKPQIVNKLFITNETIIDGGIKTIVDYCEKHNIPIENNKKAFNILSPKGNCYVIAEFRKEKTQIEKGNHIVLVNPSDAGNIGTIIRTATGFDYKNIAIISPAVDIYDPKTVRATMGALFHVNVEYFEKIEDYIDRFKDNHLYAFMLTSSKKISEVKPVYDHSLIFGNEATGLPDKYADLCETVIIPHNKDIDSLNLTIAAGIGMYYFKKPE